MCQHSYSWSIKQALLIVGVGECPHSQSTISWQSPQGFAMIAPHHWIPKPSALCYSWMTTTGNNLHELHLYTCVQSAPRILVLLSRQLRWSRPQELHWRLLPRFPIASRPDESSLLGSYFSFRAEVMHGLCKTWPSLWFVLGLDLNLNTRCLDVPVECYLLVRSAGAHGQLCLGNSAVISALDFKYIRSW